MVIKNNSYLLNITKNFKASILNNNHRSISVKVRNKIYIYISFIILFTIVLEVLVQLDKRKKSEIEINAGEKEIKMFTDSLSAYLENPRLSMKNYA